LVPKVNNFYFVQPIAFYTAYLFYLSLILLAWPCSSVNNLVKSEINFPGGTMRVIKEVPEHLASVSFFTSLLILNYSTI